jgi:hypothetical protein
MSSNTNPSPAKGSGSSPWSPFRHASFSVVWGATVISNIGGWMYSAASGWLMTDLNPDPFIVSMVQAATTLPIFLFALPAGALADIVDRRTFLIVVEVLYTTVAAIFAAIVWIGAATPGNLLLFTFLMGVGAALTAPVWQSTIQQVGLVHCPTSYDSEFPPVVVKPSEQLIQLFIRDIGGIVLAFNNDRIRIDQLIVATVSEEADVRCICKDDIDAFWN